MNSSISVGVTAEKLGEILFFLMPWQIIVLCPAKMVVEVESNTSPSSTYFKVDR